MAKRTLKYQIVRPDKLLHEGEATYVNLITRSGELGVYPRQLGKEVSEGSYSGYTADCAVPIKVLVHRLTIRLKG
jgi:hypothetical protein